MTTTRWRLAAGCDALDCQVRLLRGTALFRTKKAAEKMTRIWDAKGVPHGEIEEIDLGYDPDDIRAIGGFAG